MDVGCGLGGIGLADRSGIDVLVWDWQSCRDNLCRSGISLDMDCLNPPPLRHFGRAPIVLVPSSEWAFKH